MAISGTNSTTLDDLFVNIVAQARFTAEEQSLMLGLVTQYNIAGQAGKTVQVPKYPAITAAALEEGTAPADTDVSTSSISVTVAEVGNTVLLTDLAAMGAGNPAQELGTVLGNAIATKIDTDLINLFGDFTTGLGAAGSEVTIADLFKAAATLRANKVTGRMAAVLHPFQAYALKSGLTNSFFAGGVSGTDSVGSGFANDVSNEAMRNGYVGSVAGIDVYESANVDVDGNGDSVGAVFAPEALAIAIKRDFNLETQRNATRRGTEMVATAIYGVDTLDDSYGVKITADAVL